jgi:hypothetical protein
MSLDDRYHTPLLHPCKYVFCKNFFFRNGGYFTTTGGFHFNFIGEKPTNVTRATYFLVSLLVYRVHLCLSVPGTGKSTCTWYTSVELYLVHQTAFPVPGTTLLKNQRRQLQIPLSKLWKNTNISLSPSVDNPRVNFYTTLLPAVQTKPILKRLNPNLGFFLSFFDCIPYEIIVNSI